MGPIVTTAKGIDFFSYPYSLKFYTKLMKELESRQKRKKFSNIWRIFHISLFNAEAEFLDVIGTKFSFLHIHSHLY